MIRGYRQQTKIMTGRPTKLTPERHSRMVNAIKIGAYNYVAAAAAGIDEKTYANWMERGESDWEHGKRTVFAAFFRDIKDAEGQAEIAHLAHIVKAGSQHWQARAWILERKWPNRWGRRERIELTGKNGAPLVKTPTTQERRQEVARILRDAEEGT